jgi:diamine N-acetyltransferase
MKLERVQKSEVKELLELAEPAFRAAFQHLNNPADFENFMVKHFAEPKWRAELNDPHVEFWWTKNTSGEPLGFIKLNQNRPHDGFDCTKETIGRQMELERIYVKTGQKGLGIGHFLIEKALERAKSDGADWIWLGVWEHNPSAILFYEKHGFEYFGKHKFLIGNDVQVDCLMRKSTKFL